MALRQHVILTAALAFAGAAKGEAVDDSLLGRHWFEARTAHIDAYSCGTTQAVARVVGRLEQFRDAYSLLAGRQAVASPAIVVMAFPGHETMQPFLALYQGKPANQAAFFVHGSDENLIVVSLTGEDALDSIFHEYTHLLLRHNDRIWPPWLEEGMAEIYSTFAVSGGHTIRIGHPIERHLELLRHSEFMPLSELLTATHESSAYNEREHQGVFYAESWLLTHYLMLGDNPGHKARFGQLTALLRQGQSPVQAFTNAFGTSLAAMELQLHAYLERDRFTPLSLTVTTDLSAPRALATRPLSQQEICFRLGDQLLRVQRLESARAYFERARQIAPASPLGFEGLGLIEAERQQHGEAAQLFGEAVQHGSSNFLAHYFYAREKYEMAGDSEGRHGRMQKEAAEEVRGELEKSVALMPNFGPAQELLGFFEMVQGEELPEAEQHLRRAIELEPERLGYRFSLAEIELLTGDTEAARQTLESLRLPYVDPPLRAEAEELLRKMNRRSAGGQ